MGFGSPPRADHMKVMLLIPMFWHGRVRVPGDVVDLPDKRAQRMVDDSEARLTGGVETAALDHSGREVTPRKRRTKTVEA